MLMDEKTAEHYVRQYADTILRIAYTWLGNMDDAKDIVQITLIKALRDGRHFEDIGQERAWITKIAVNSCKDWKKSAYFRHTTGFDEALCLVEETRHESDPSILQAVGKLPPKYRQVIYLRYYEEYSIKEIAALLDLSSPLVSTRLARAKKKLKKIMGDDYFG